MNQTASRRVLIPVTYGFSVRYFLPTGLLDGLRDVCELVVGMGWSDPDLERLLVDGGFEVVRLPAARLDHDYRMYKRRLAIVHERRLASPTTRLRRARVGAQERPSVRLIGQAKRLRDEGLVLLPGGAARVESQEREAVASGTNVAEFGRFLVTHQIDALLSATPYHSQDGLLLSAATSLGLPTITAVISFDNPTTRERMMVRSDRIAVWNRYNSEEVLRSYPDVAASRITVTGAPQFDLHHRDDLLLPEPDWRRRAGLPDDRPILLYGAGPSSLVPGEEELVALIDRSISDKQIRVNPYLLVRRHPADPMDRWQALAPRLQNSTIVDPWPIRGDPNLSWPTDVDLAMQMSSLAHSHVHINVCSTMTVDGAVFDRPQIGPMFIPGAPPATNEYVANFYRQEHWLPIARSGGLVTAGDEGALIDAINEGLEHPERRQDERRKLTEEILTYVDGCSSLRLIDQVRELLAEPVGNA